MGWKDDPIIEDRMDLALKSENVSGHLADVARSIYKQESGSGANISTSNAGAVGHMQIIPDTFNRVADKGWDIKNPEHNLRAGVRYLKMLDQLAGGDPKLIAAGYYGGEGAIPLAAKGKALRDPKNPDAPDTLQYAAQVASRLPKYEPWKNDPVVEDMPSFADVKSGAETSKDTGRQALERAMNRPMGQLISGGISGVGRMVSGAEFLIDKMKGGSVSDIVTGQTPRTKFEARNKDLDRQLQAVGVDTEGLLHQAGRLGGEVAATTPLIKLAGLGVAAGGLPRLGGAVGSMGMTTGANVSKGVLPAAGDLAIRAGGGAAAGTIGAGLLDADAAGIGAGIGGALPLVTKAGGLLGNYAGNIVRSVRDPLTNKGQDSIIGRAIAEAAGGTDRAAAAASRMEQASTPISGPFRPGVERSIAGEIVPGSIPTAGQISGNAGIAALERSASAVNPQVLVTNAERLAAQNAARIRAMEDMSGSEGLRQFTRTELEATADDLYKNAFAKGMDLRRDAETGKFLSKAEQAGRKGEINKLLKNPYIAEAVDEAKKLMQGSFKSIDGPAGSVEGLHFVKKALDDKIAKTTGNEQRIIIGARDRLLTTIDSMSPEYAAARSVFRDMAKPVNQMDTAAEILKNSVTPSGNMTLDKFARSNTDKSAVSAQKFKKATLEKTMSDEQLNALNAIHEDLRRANFAKTEGKGVGSDTAQKLAYSNMLGHLGIPQTIRALSPSQLTGRIAARGADLIYSDANRQMAEKLALALADPAQAARLIRMATTAKNTRPIGYQPAGLLAARSAPALPASLLNHE